MKSTLVAEPETVSRLGEVASLEGGAGRAREETSAPAAPTTTTMAPSPSRRSTPMQKSIVLAGTSFKTSSLAFREALLRRLDRDSAKLPRLLGAREYAQLITCNRIEILVVSDSADPTEASFRDWLSRTEGIAPGYVYLRKDFDAVTHLFRVASGLDSMVLGEEQILAQVNEAGITARKSRSSRGNLSALFDTSVNVGKRVRATLKNADQSVSSTALRFALDHLPGGPGSVLLIGTGKTARLAANLLDGAKLYVATRRSSVPPAPSFSRATVIAHKDLRRIASSCDLIISATKHRGYLLRKGDLDERKRVILDLAFPRNIDPALKAGQTEVYDLEDLGRILASHTQSTGPEAGRAEQLVVAEAKSFSRWLLASRQSSTLSRVYRWAEETRRKETAAALRRLPDLSTRERKVVEVMSRRLVSKLLAPPTSFVKSSSPELPQEQRLDFVQRIFEQGGG